MNHISLWRLAEHEFLRINQKCCGGEEIGMADKMANL